MRLSIVPQGEKGHSDVRGWMPKPRPHNHNHNHNHNRLIIIVIAIVTVTVTVTVIRRELRSSSVVRSRGPNAPVF
jgi:hypothetical protein